MTIDGMTVFWLTRLIDLGEFFGIVSFLGIVVIIILGIAMAINHGDSLICPELSSSKLEAATAKKLFSIIKRAAIPLLCVTLLAVLIPSRQDMALILGAELANKTVTNLAPEMDLLRQWADKELKKQIEESK